ncbi:MAG: hypothetical protein ACR2H2_01085 [Solirubrobacteraceae bacterium]
MTVLQRLEGSAYRDGQLVCARAAVTVVADAPSARRVRVHFVEGVDQRLRDELERLLARRGAFATRNLCTRLVPATARPRGRAVQRQLTRWAKADLDPDKQRQVADLRQALQVLRHFRDGCELHPIHDEGHRPGSG